MEWKKYQFGGVKEYQFGGVVSGDKWRRGGLLMLRHKLRDTRDTKSEDDDDDENFKDDKMLMLHHQSRDT